MNTQRNVLTYVAVAAAALAIPTAGLAAAAHAQPATPYGQVCPAVPDGLTLIVPHTGGLVATNSTGGTLLDAPIGYGPNLGVRGPDGTVWVESQPDGVFGVYRIPPGGPATLVADGDVALTGVGWFDGRSAAALLDWNNPQPSTPEYPPYGAVTVDASDGQQTNGGPAGGWEWNVSTATIGAGRVVLSGSSEGFEWFAYRAPGGTELDDWFSPETPEPAMPPYHDWPIPAVATDGNTPILSWVEHTGVGDFELVVADAISGADRMRLPLGAVGNLLHADFDGRFWVGTFADEATDAPDVRPDRVIVVDTQAASPTVVDAGCPPGATGTIDRLGTPQPTVTPPPVAPTPTLASEPQQPAQCEEYVLTDFAYPIRNCEYGFDVQLVQRMLAQRGYPIDVDDHFGPATEAVVRRFQQDAGLEVDGLVDLDTWSALYTGDPAGNDNDGNGIVDPWEIPADGPGGGESPDDIPPAEEFEAIAFTIVDDDQIVDLASGNTVATLLQRFEVGTDTNGLPAQILHVNAGGEGQLWFVKFHFDTGETWGEIVHVEHLGALAAGMRVSGDCGRQGVVAVVQDQQGSPPVIVKAWFYDGDAWEVEQVSDVACT